MFRGKYTLAIIILASAGIFAIAIFSLQNQERSTSSEYLEQIQARDEEDVWEVMSMSQKSENLTQPYTDQNGQIIQELNWSDGVSVSLIANAIPPEQKSETKYIEKCPLPEFERASVGIAYGNTVIRVGEIGLPKNKDGAWQTAEYPVAFVGGGGGTSDVAFEWSPLRRMGENIFAVIDYASVYPEWRVIEEGGYVFEGCNYSFTAYLFRIYEDGFFGVNAHSPLWENEMGGMHRLLPASSDIYERGRTWRDNCSPSGCG